MSNKIEKKIKKKQSREYIRKYLPYIGIGLVIIIEISFIFKETFEINGGYINKANLFFLSVLTYLFGSMLQVVLISFALFCAFSIFRKFNILEKVFYSLSMLLFSAYMSINLLGESFVNSNLLNTGRALLELGFEGKGAGLIGAVSGTILTKFGLSARNILYLALIMLIISLYKFLYDIFRMVYEYIKYLKSPEYIRKKELLQLKKQIDKEYYEKTVLKEEKKIHNMLVDIKEESLNRKLAEKPNKSNSSESKYYTEEELNELYEKMKEMRKEKEKEKNKEVKDEQINNKIEEIVFTKKAEEKLEEIEKDEKKELENSEEVFEKVVEDSADNIEETFTVYENKEEEKIHVNEEISKIEEISPVNDIKVEEENKALRINDPELRKSIDEVFVYKKVDEEKKKEMLKSIEENIVKLEEVLKDYGVEAEVTDYSTGPTITRYEIKIPSGVRIVKVTQLSSEIAMKLEAESIRMEAPIPGKGTIGIETPNKIKESVHFSNLIHNKEIDEMDLGVVLGKDVVGKEKIIDIAKAPHLLIAGTTGSGKSVCINTIISTLISKKSDDEVKLILIDPKMVELMPYNEVPHLLVPVIIDPTMAAIALKWAVLEMEERYKKLAELGVRNIKAYNKVVKNEKMPYIVIVIDELADLMMVSANTVEKSIARIAQKARAIGIHLIVATQRPSTDVVTGLIKSNLPSRISFALRSQIDSRTILDQIGAEKLIGKGDMLILENGSYKLERIQGAFISDEEVKYLTNILKAKKKAVYNMEILEDTGDEEQKDELFSKACKIVEESPEDKITISYLQGKLKIGFSRASKIVQLLKDEGILDEYNMKINY